MTPEKPGNAQILRQIIAFSPRYGANPLDKEEKIEITRTNKDRWTVTADLEDFKFEGSFNFSDSTVVTNRYRRMYE